MKHNGVESAYRPQQSSLCAGCGRPSTLRCSKCRSVYYCHRDCQAAHWREHRQSCDQLARQAAAAAARGHAAPGGLAEPRAPLCGRGFRRWLEARPDWRWSLQLVEDPSLGFTNWDNNCYLNAVLQCLLHTHLLRRNLLAACPAPKDPWLAELAGVYRTAETARERRNGMTADPPRRLSRLISEASDEFAYGRQADAHEAVMLLISRFLAGCLAEGDGSARDCARLGYQEKEVLEASSLVGHVFGMNLGQKVSCQSCSYESCQSRVEYCLCLNVTLGMTPEELRYCREESAASMRWHLYRRGAPNRASESAVTPTTLAGLLHEYAKPEHIADWQCEKCKHRGGVRSAYLRRRPNVLMVYIDRRQDSHLFGKINRRVTFPAQLDLAPWLRSEDDEGRTCFSLYAMIVHRDVRGSADYGHYVALVRGRAGSWYLLDDTTVRQVEWPQVQAQHPYLLFYVAEDPVMPFAVAAPAAAEEKGPAAQKGPSASGPPQPAAPGPSPHQAAAPPSSPAPPAPAPSGVEQRPVSPLSTSAPSTTASSGPSTSGATDSEATVSTAGCATPDSAAVEEATAAGDPTASTPVAVAC